MCAAPLLSSACDVIVVRGAATGDGSVVLVGLYQWSDSLDQPYCLRHADRQTHAAGSTVALSCRVVPQVPQTWAYNYVHCRWRGAEDRVPAVVHAVNEWGLAIASNSLFCGEPREKKPEGVDFLDVNRLVAERARDARQAVALIGHLIDSYGYAMHGKDRDDGQLWAVADCREAWVVECLGGQQWVARRIEEDVYNGSNTPTITDRYDLGSDVVRYARDHGWLDSPKTFNWARDFAPPQAGWQDRYLAISRHLADAARAGPITPERIVEMLRSPVFTRIKGFDQIQSAMIAHLRPGVPPELRAKAYFAAGPDAGERPFVPLYACHRAGWHDVPDHDAVLQSRARLAVPRDACIAYERWAWQQSLAVEHDGNGAAQQPSAESRAPRLQCFHDTVLQRAADVYAQAAAAPSLPETRAEAMLPASDPK